MTYGVVYLITNKITGKQYVGQTVDFKRRLGRYPNYQTPAYIDNAIMKYGKTNFTFEIIDRSATSKEMLYSLERGYIKSYNTLYPNGYNMTPGGDGGNIREDLDTPIRAMAVTGTRSNPVYNLLPDHWFNLLDCVKDLGLLQKSKSDCPLVVAKEISRMLNNTASSSNLAYGYRFFFESPDLQKDIDHFKTWFPLSQTCKKFPWEPFVAVDTSGTIIYDGQSVMDCARLLGKGSASRVTALSSGIPQCLTNTLGHLYTYRFAFKADTVKVHKLQTEQFSDNRCKQITVISTSTGEEIGRFNTIKETWEFLIKDNNTRASLTKLKARFPNLTFKS